MFTALLDNCAKGILDRLRFGEGWKSSFYFNQKRALKTDSKMMSRSFHANYMKTYKSKAITSELKGQPNL